MDARFSKQLARTPIGQIKVRVRFTARWRDLNPSLNSQQQLEEGGATYVEKEGGYFEMEMPLALLFTHHHDLEEAVVHSFVIPKQKWRDARAKTASDPGTSTKKKKSGST